MDEQNYWCIFPSELELWWSDAEEITARDADEAAEFFLRDFGDGDEDDCDEVDVIVASDRQGTDAKRIAVVCYVERSYSADKTFDDEITIPPCDEDSLAEWSDMADDESDRPEPIKGRR